jgi:hypothetical protein
MQYAPPGDGPWRLYVFDRGGYHRGGRYFARKPMPANLGESHLWLTREAARDDATRALRQGLEVRITDAGDRLVFHAKGLKQLYPLNPDTFWNATKIRTIIALLLAEIAPEFADLGNIELIIAITARKIRSTAALERREP